MVFVASIVPVSPVRAEASHRSEITSQLLFGEVAELLEETKDFKRIRNLYDGYEGWCQRTQLEKITDPALPGNKLLCAGWSNQVMFNDTVMQLSLGTPLTLFNNGKAVIGQFHAVYNGATWDPEQAVFNPENIRKVAMPFLNTAYLWGGRSVFGIDCSGFVQQVYRFFNLKLQRDAYQQAEQGEVVGFLQEAICGDLAFFDNENGRITHVGLMLDNQTIIHASGRVRIDTIDNAGIISSDTGERTHNLRVIKRYASHG
ncbi:C40 family peptidase [Sediminibacterium ginsengisoli]|uniref:Cell wall-associated hydrolase, NlpC family n=1 Tax=Sediminibacterium ginsengisoli TaxID=413434 RepID=A0A1T4R7X2_9BACT|nr:C40 family peptidase [Sediminibacterium ginsengisoli]SKA11997.1 Cell wall-associated hydrolase, NlpC family [Sediminibacterium ginsengisoli]